MVNQEGRGLQWILDLKTGLTGWIVYEKKKVG